MAGTVAWTTPAVLAVTSNPAAAATVSCAAGNFYVVYNYLGQISPISAALCNGTGTNVAASTIGLTVPSVSFINHVITGTPNTSPVQITLDNTCNCVISSVRAHVHKWGPPNNVPPDCPNPYCQTATVGGTYLQITAGAIGTKTVTVRPSTNTALCGNVGIHWGSSFNTTLRPSGQENGYLVVNVTCT